MDHGKTETGMNLLAIETSVSNASLCLYAGGAVRSSAAWQAERNHDAHLFPALQQAMAALGNKPALDYVLVGAGPGSYGGVRVALAAGVGIATVCGAKLVAVESWAQLAEGDACVVADARRGGWTVRFPDGRIEVLSPAELAAVPHDIYSTEPIGRLAGLSLSRLKKEGLVPSAEGLVQTWLGMSQEEREQVAAKPAEPIYVRPPHITVSTRKPWEI
jgi:tRNA threonylcarbamoyladenosine biosynthesis protein TsaB